MLLLLALLLAAPKPGDRVHVSGCENGELVVPLVNLWATAERTGAGFKVVGKVSGTGGTKSRCDGGIVIIREVKEIPGDGFTRYRVETVIGEQSGWVGGIHLGKPVSPAMCELLLEGEPPATIAKCKGP